LTKSPNGAVGEFRDEHFKAGIEALPEQMTCERQASLPDFLFNLSRRPNFDSFFC
jgi:hypothetical protein